jgi:biopolymer transport protein ExbD
MHVPSLRTNKKARIEIIPLIDIMFFLLATFMMVSLSMVKNRGIPVNLPAAVTAAPQEREEYVALTLTRDGELYFNKERIPRDELGPRLERFRAAHPDPRVFINGDEQAAFGDAIAILDQVRQLGITRVAIETRAPAAPAREQP